MAQAATAMLPPVNGLPKKPENWEVTEYEKILRFRDQVLAGLHPRVKVPAHLVGKLNASPRTVSSPSHPTQRPTTLQAQSTLGSSHDGNNKNPPDAQQHTPSSRSAASVPNMTKSATELDPIFLSKSEELVKAEIQLQRQRLERNLRDQIEQQKIAVKLALKTTEFLPDFDLNEVYNTALQSIQPDAGADGDFPAGPAASDSDSFDENTFYSSQHDTPDNQSLASQDDKAAGDVEMLDAPVVDQSSSLAHTGSAYPRSPGLVPSGIASQKQPEPARATAQEQSQPPRAQPRYSLRGNILVKNVPGENFDEPMILEDASTSAKDSSNTSPANNSHDPAQDSTDSNAAQQPGRRPLDSDPYYRATHNLSPIAPQPARVSPLLNANAPAVNQQPFGVSAQPAPEIVRQNAFSSPEGRKKRRTKAGKQRKLDRKQKGQELPDAAQNVFREVVFKDIREKAEFTRKNPAKRAASPMPYIKPEPRSPSPFEPLARPLKKQRQSFQTADGLDYDEPRRDRQEELPVVLYDDMNVPPRQADQTRGGELRTPVFRERDEILRARDDSDIRRNDGDFRRIASVQHARRPQSPVGEYALPYTPTEIRHVRAGSQAVFERPPARYYREEQIPRREIVDLDRERSRSPVFRERRTPLPMAPPRIVPERIVVDEHGRRYYAPAPDDNYYPAPSSMSVSGRYSVAPPSARPREVVRYSVAPPARGPNHEVIYERAPPRAAPEVIADEYDDRRFVYRRPVSPQFVVPPVRRVIQQSEREGTVDPRAYREREYSTRPVAMAPPDEYVRIRAPVGSRQMSHYPEAPREYVSRASVRPEPVRYEIPREYVGRLQSVRPEALGREFAPRAEPRREMIREASVRPGEPGLVRREYMAPPPMDGERYGSARPIRRAVEEPIYIDGPEPRNDALPDDDRRDVYR